MSTLTYDGPFPRAVVTLPDRRVNVVRGGTYEFAADEVEHLDAGAWKELRPAAATQGPPTADQVVQGTVDEVVDAAGGDPELARGLLVAEEAGRNRKTLVERLQAIVDNAASAATNPADEATDHAQEG